MARIPAASFYVLLLLRSSNLSRAVFELLYLSIVVALLRRNCILAYYTSNVVTEDDSATWRAVYLNASLRSEIN